jgi:hypothetical protein
MPSGLSTLTIYWFGNLSGSAFQRPQIERSYFKYRARFECRVQNWRKMVVLCQIGKSSSVVTEVGKEGLGCFAVSVGERGKW